MCDITPLFISRLGGNGRSAAEARRFVEQALCLEHAQGETRDDAVLLASELVAQALVAGTRPVRLSLHCQVTRVEMAVSALGLELWSMGDFPRHRAFLIDELAPGWRVDYTAEGPTYRCMLDTSPVFAGPAVVRG